MNKTLEVALSFYLFFRSLKWLYSRNEITHLFFHFSKRARHSSSGCRLPFSSTNQISFSAAKWGKSKFASTKRSKSQSRPCVSTFNLLAVRRNNPSPESKIPCSRRTRQMADWSGKESPLGKANALISAKETSWISMDFRSMSRFILACCCSFNSSNTSELVAMAKPMSASKSSKSAWCRSMKILASVMYRVILFSQMLPENPPTASPAIQRLLTS